MSDLEKKLLTTLALMVVKVRRACGHDTVRLETFLKNQDIDVLRALTVLYYLGRPDETYGTFEEGWTDVAIERYYDFSADDCVRKLIENTVDVVEEYFKYGISKL